MRKRDNRCERSQSPRKIRKVTKSTAARNAPCRVFCFGDRSFTGVSSSKKSCLTPYASELQKSLRLYPGFESTIAQTLYFNPQPITSMKPESYSHVMDKISMIQNSLIVILAGVHDLSLDGMTSDVLVDSIIRLHQEAHKRGIRTIALGLPPSHLQEVDHSVKVLTGEVNRNLQEWTERCCQRASPPMSSNVTFVPFPILKYDERDDVWVLGFHFNEAGNRLIGSSLAPFIRDAFMKSEERSK